MDKNKNTETGQELWIHFKDMSREDFGSLRIGDQELPWALLQKVKDQEKKIEGLQSVLYKLISEFERHSHNGLGIAVIPVS